ncbi:MAG: PHP domain-containing protein [Ruminococcus sp.]|jgi:putative hydrolase|nr:PHP domain-containing protein [Ruminococcus sp.]
MNFIADTHTHTVGSTHAYSTILENARVAADRGLKFLAITDHGPNDNDPPHIWHFHNMERSVDRELFGVKMLFGMEASITGADGSLNIEAGEIMYLDWVIASVHYPVEGNPSDYTGVYERVADNPFVDVIGHCAQPYYPFNYDKILPIFCGKNKLVEINETQITHRHRSPENRELLQKCMEYNVPVIINSDAHFCNRVGEFFGSQKLLEELNFPEELVVNSSEDRFIRYLKVRRKENLWR